MEATFGEELIGYKFNPSANKDVDIIKKTFASIVDLVETFRPESRVGKITKEASLHACITAQMLIVKLITLK